MPGTTYIIRFTHRTLGSGIPYEEQEHIDLAQAWEAFRLFAEPDSADLYAEIELVEHGEASSIDCLMTLIWAFVRLET